MNLQRSSSTTTLTSQQRRADRLPAYAQVKAYIRDMIYSGRLSGGDQLPTQSQFCAELGVSRITVVRALQDLEQEGLVESRQGVGTFVRQPTQTISLTHVSQLFKQTFSTDGPPIHRLVALEQLDEHPTRMGNTLESAGRLWRIVRLRVIDDQSVGYEESFLPVARVPAGADPAATEKMLLYDFLTDHCGVALVSTRVQISATTLSDEEAELLGGAPGDPGLLITRVTVGVDGRPVSISLNTLPANVSSYFFEFNHEIPSAEPSG